MELSLIVAFTLMSISAIDVSRRQPIYSALTLYAWFLAISVFVLFIMVSTKVQSRILYINHSSISLGSREAILIYGSQAFILWCSARAFGNACSRSFSVRDSIIGKSAISAFPIMVLAFFTISLVGFHALDMSWNSAWRASSYLALNSPDYVGIGFPPAAFYHLAMPVISVIAGVFAALTFRRQPLASTVLTIVFLYGVLFQAAAHSRWAGVGLLAVGAAVFGVSRTVAFRYALAGPLLVCGVAFYVSAILGRNTGNHGFATIFSTFTLLDPRLIFDVVITLTYTIFEGIMTTAQAVLIKTDHPEIYRTLSFSPLPSAIDGFSDIRAASEVRVNAFTPMGAWVEALKFGLPYSALWFAFMMIVFCGNAAMNVAVRSPVGLALNASTFVFVLLTNAYAIRNSFRIILVVAVSQLIVCWLSGRKAEKTNREIVGPDRKLLRFKSGSSPN